MDETIATAAGLLRVQVAGPPDGPVVVLRHGVLLSSEIWTAVVAAIPAVRVVMIDGPGHGGSGAPPRGYDLDADARALIEVLDALGVDRAVLVGHSWGGMVHLRVAATRPDRVLALALLNTPLTPPGLAARTRYRLLRAFVRAVGTPTAVARRIAAALMSPVSLRRDPSLVDRVVDGLRGADRRGLARVIRAVLVHPDDGMPHLDRITAPTLIAAGVDDYVLDAATERDVRRRLPAARIVLLPGGHVSPLEAPAQTAALLAEWLVPVLAREDAR